MHTGLLATTNLRNACRQRRHCQHLGPTITAAVQPTPPNSQAESWKDLHGFCDITGPRMRIPLAARRSLTDRDIINGFNQGLSNRFPVPKLVCQRKPLFIRWHDEYACNRLKFGAAFDDRRSS